MSTIATDKAQRWARQFRREHITMGLLSLALFGLVFNYIRTVPLPSVLVVAAPHQARMSDAPGLSPEKELLERFRMLNGGVEVRLVFTNTPEEVLELVEQGKAQIGLALGVAPTEADRRQNADAGKQPRMAFGPEYDRQPIYAIDWNAGYLPTGTVRPAMDELLRVAASFSQDPVLAPALPLDALHLLLPFLPEVRDVAPTGREAGYRFVWRTDVPRLDKAMRSFWNELAADGTLPALRERAMGFLPQDPDPFEMEMLRRTLALYVPPHAGTIAKASRRWKLDPFVLTAVIHQESRFDPDAVSITGVHGLMQLTGVTRERLGVDDQSDDAQVITAGARYLDMLREYFIDLGYGREDAMLLGLAAFNVGQGHVEDAIKIAQAGRSTLPAWTAVRRVLPTLADMDVAKDTRYGLCRGFEAVEFVDKVRYFAYAIKGLIQIGPQRDQLSGLRLALAH
ncbi:MAG: transglycosylase SLT domain-containing protein [Humidesulfovibrio sp.]|nr:transglycosylase SLT domain-containing protein [Humidesulfovibrio sp.]